MKYKVQHTEERGDSVIDGALGVLQRERVDELRRSGEGGSETRVREKKNKLGESGQSEGMIMTHCSRLK